MNLFEGFLIALSALTVIGMLFVLVDAALWNR